MDSEMLDREISEKFFGWTRNEIGWWIDSDGNFQEFVVEFRPSIDPKFSAKVLDELERRGWWYRLQNTNYPSDPIEFKVIRDREYVGHAYEATRHRAICAAVLLAIETEESE